jgi:hypothetical protein
MLRGTVLTSAALRYQRSDLRAHPLQIRGSNAGERCWMMEDQLAGYDPRTRREILL